MNSRWQRALVLSVPESIRQWVRAKQRRFRLQAVRTGTLQWGSLRRVAPISAAFAFDRGLPVDRYYIEQFLAAHAADIRGHVLEFGDDRYTRQFGGTRVARSDVLDLVADRPRHTLQADLVRADHIPANTFDCIICTQTLQMIFDIRAAVAQLWRILAPGGVLLVTSHGISRISRREGVDDWGEYWHLTAQSAQKLFAEAVTTGSFTVATYGNVMAAVAELHGLAAEELDRGELDHHDLNYEVIIGVRAVKSTTSR